VKVGLNTSAQDLVWVVPKEDLIQGGIEMLCLGLVLTRLGANIRGQRVEEVSRLEHELASANLKQSLAANTNFETRAVKLERTERERSVEEDNLKEALERVDNRVSLLEAESFELWVENLNLPATKEEIKVDLDKTIDDTLVMLGESFDQVVRQAHLLYNGAPLSDNFDINMDVFEGRMLPCGEVEVLKATAQQIATEGAGDKDH